MTGSPIHDPYPKCRGAIYKPAAPPRPIHGPPAVHISTTCRPHTNTPTTPQPPARRMPSIYEPHANHTSSHPDNIICLYNTGARGTLFIRYNKKTDTSRQ